MTDPDRVDLDKRTTLRRFAAVGAMSPFAGLVDTASAEPSEGGESTRHAIVGYLSTTPGAHFSKVRDDLGLGTGETQYHLEELLDRGAVVAYADGDYRRFVPAGRFSPFERTALGHLRRETARGVLITLLESPDATGREIADRVGVSPATVSRTLADLTAADLVDRNEEIRVRRPETIITLLVRYADSFDREVQEFANAVDTLIVYRPDADRE